MHRFDQPTVALGFFRWLKGQSIFVCGLLALVCSGCGDGASLVNVRGLVKLDGVPLAGASVSFHPTEKGDVAYADTGEDGSFQLQTIRQERGASPGVYQVTVSKVESPEISSEDGSMPMDLNPQKYQPIWHTPQRYSQPETSGFEIEVKQGMKPVELALISQSRKLE